LSESIQTITKAFALLSHRDRRRMKLILPAYMSLGFLDLLGVVFLGTVATIGFSSITRDSKPSRLEVILGSILPLEISRNTLIIVLTASAISFLLLKTLLQAMFDYKYTKFSARLESDIASRLYNSILNGEISTINTKSYSEYHYALMVGSNRLVVGIIAPCMSFIADTFTTLMMFCFALYASPISTAIVFVVFLLSYLIFNGPISNKAKHYGISGADSYLKITDVLQESIVGIKEVRVYGKENFYKNGFKIRKTESSIISQKVMWMNGIIRYILEISILLSGSLVAVVSFLTQDLRETITITSIFLLIGFRLIPTVQRLQNSVNSVKISRESTRSLFDLLEEFPSKDFAEKRDEKFTTSSFAGISFQEVGYDIDEHNSILQSISFELKKDLTLAIVGESGAGKSTLVDLLVGLYKPSRGAVAFKNLGDPSKTAPGNFDISFISQNCALFGRNVYENVTLENTVSDADKARIDLILDGLQLDHLKESSFGVERKIRSNSTNISGGEKQRISLARAKFFDRGIVVLDEPTSSLDQENEKRIIEYLMDIQHNKTVVLVTHSESLLRAADMVLVLDQGKMLFYGSNTEFYAWKTLSDRQQ
jgi:ABC-type multidrug transport system fused ATPase/permease subunit